MSVKVASLYAEIGANVDGFVRGAGQVKSQLKSITPQFERAAGGVSGFITANAGLISVLTAVGVATNKLINDYAAYAESVALVSRTAGTTAEEASRLIQVADDMGVTMQELNTMTRKMTMEGITPSIEAMAALSDQYIAIQDPAERAKFLLDNFGRSGAEMGRLMEQGSEGIYAMNGAIDENLILTGDALKQAEEYRLATDELTDSFEGFKMSVGGDVLPFLVTLLQKANMEIKEAGGLVGWLKDQWVLLLGPVGAVIRLYDIFSNRQPTAPAPPRAPTAPRTRTAPRPATPSWQNGTQRPFTPTPGTRDNGGAGIAGTPYQIGVPEVYVPNTGGEFIPLGGAKGKGLGTTYNIVVNNPKKETAENSIRDALKNMSYLGAAA